MDNLLDTQLLSDVRESLAVHKQTPRAMWRSAVLIALSSLMMGFSLASLNSCLVLGGNNSSGACYHGDDDSSTHCPKGSMYTDIDLNTFEASIATTMTLIGAWIGCIAGSFPAETYGRKMTLLYNNGFYILGALGSASGELNLLYAGRFLNGLGVGITSIIVPVLLSEIATESIRGTITTIHQVFLTSGILLAFLVGFYFVSFVVHGWQFVQACLAIPAFIMLALSPLIPESPKWLLAHKNDRHSAKLVLEMLREPGTDVEIEIDVIVSQNEKAHKDPSRQATWHDVFQHSKTVIIGCGLMAIHVLVGINAVIFYSSLIFNYAGSNESSIATIIVGLVNLLTTCSAAFIVDKVGRKTLMMNGTTIMLFGSFVFSITLWTGHGDLGDPTMSFIAVTAVLVYVFGFAIGLGAVSWVVMTELMPTKLRSKSFSVFVSVNWICNIIIGLLTLPAIDELGGVNGSETDDAAQTSQRNGVAALYMIFAGIILCSLLFIHYLVPETKVEGNRPRSSTEEEVEIMTKAKYRPPDFMDKLNREAALMNSAPLTPQKNNSSSNSSPMAIQSRRPVATSQNDLNEPLFIGTKSKANTSDGDALFSRADSEFDL